jgi:hypothetical protein
LRQDPQKELNWFRQRQFFESQERITANLASNNTTLCERVETWAGDNLEQTCSGPVQKFSKQRRTFLRSDSEDPTPHFNALNEKPNR